MPGTTPELGLSTALTTDDQIAYLTTNLAASLTTLDGLFGATGHDHSGAGDGAPIAPATAIPPGTITPAMILDPYTQPTIATPTTFPPAGSLRIYPKADGEYYKIDPSGVETLLAPPGVTMPLTEALTFSPANTHDIGDAAGLATPKDAYIGGRVFVGGASGPPLEQDTPGSSWLALRGGVQGNLLRIYSTYTDATNYDRTVFGHGQVETEAMGTGVGMALMLGGVDVIFKTGGQARWGIYADGRFAPANVSGALDIGSPDGALFRPRSVYIEGVLQQFEQTTPTLPNRPPAGSYALYPKVDGYYQIDSAGVETALFTSGAAAIPPVALTGSMHQIGSTMIDQIIAALVTHGIVTNAAVTP